MIVLGICGKALRLQAVIHVLADDGIENSKQGDAQNHARKAEQPAAQNDGKDYPKGRQTCGFAQKDVYKRQVFGCGGGKIADPLGCEREHGRSNCDAFHLHQDR